MNSIGAMPKKIEHKVKQEVIRMAARGMKEVQIAETLGICINTIWWAKYNVHKHGDIEGGKKKPGPKQKLTYHMEEVNSEHLQIEGFSLPC